MTSARTHSGRSARTFDPAWIAVIAAILLVVIIRVRLLQIPLERDEGEYAYMGQLMLHGVPPFAVAYNMKLPGTYAAYALAMALFGQSIAGVHLGFLLVNIASIVMMFLLGRRLFGSLAGAVASISYAILAVHPGVDGTQAHATHFVIVCVLAGCLLLLKSVETRKLSTVFWSGLFFGLAFVMKQPGLLFLLFGALYLLWTDRRVRGSVGTPRWAD